MPGGTERATREAVISAAMPLHYLQREGELRGARGRGGGLDLGPCADLVGFHQTPRSPGCYARHSVFKPPKALGVAARRLPAPRHLGGAPPPATRGRDARGQRGLRERTSANTEAGGTDHKQDLKARAPPAAVSWPPTRLLVTAATTRRAEQESPPRPPQDAPPNCPHVVSSFRAARSTRAGAEGRTLREAL